MRALPDDRDRGPICQHYQVFLAIDTGQDDVTEPRKDPTKTGTTMITTTTMTSSKMTAIKTSTPLHINNIRNNISNITTTTNSATLQQQQQQLNQLQQKRKHHILLSTISEITIAGGKKKDKFNINIITKRTTSTALSWVLRGQIGSASASLQCGPGSISSWGSDPGAVSEKGLSSPV